MKGQFGFNTNQPNQPTTTPLVSNNNSSNSGASSTTTNNTITTSTSASKIKLTNEEQQLIDKNKSSHHSRSKSGDLSYRKGHAYVLILYLIIIYCFFVVALFNSICYAMLTPNCLSECSSRVLITTHLNLILPSST